MFELEQQILNISLGVLLQNPTLTFHRGQEQTDLWSQAQILQLRKSHLTGHYTN